MKLYHLLVCGIIFCCANAAIKSNWEESGNKDQTQKTPFYLAAISNLPKGAVFKQVSYNILNPNVCGGLWKKTGTICDQAKITEFSLQDQASMATAKTTLDQNLQELLDIAKNLIAESSLPTDKMESIADLIDPSTVEAAKESAVKCWSYMAKARSSAICFMCSGENYKYFFKGKALITEDECSVMFDHCRRHIKFV